MTHLIHTVATLVYTAVAIAVALTLPLVSETVGRDTAMLAGVVVFLAGALVHEIATRLDREQNILHRLDREEKVVRQLLSEVRLRSSDDVLPLPSSAAPDLALVMAEVRLLHSLVGQLAGQIGPTGDKDSQAPPDVGGEGGQAAPPAMPPQVSADDQSMLAIAREALAADRIDLFLQPICSLPQRKAHYYQVSSYIRVSDGSYLPPERYVPMAERAGLIAAIDDLLLFRSVRLVRETKRRQDMTGFFVGISSPTLRDDTFMKDFATYIADHSDLGQRLTLVVAQADIEEGLLRSPFVRLLVAQGCGFCMDRVQSFDIDPVPLAREDVRFIKLDASLLLALANRPGGRANVLQFKRLIESRPINVIVEQITTEAQLVELLDLQTDFGQGSLLGDPFLSQAAQY